MEKIKQFIESEQGKDVFVVLIVILVGLSSFGLGRLSKNTPNQGLKIEYPGTLTNQEDTVVSALGAEAPINSKVPSVSNSVGKSFFASKRGQKYYSIGCSAGKTIKQENRIYFSTSAEAEKAGFTPSSSCTSR